MDLEGMVNKYVVTTAQKGANINKGFYENLMNYCEVNKAELIILPTSGKTIADEDIGIHPDLHLHKVITKNYKLNDSLRISDFQIKPQQILPLTGIKRFAQGDKSFIFASTKQQIQYVANSYDLIPKAVMTTGAITQPYYKDNRIGIIAHKDHEYGAVIVEIENNKYFHHRFIKAQSNGNFMDLGISYGSNKQGVEYLVMGDLHAYYACPKHLKVTKEQIKDLKPKYLVLHDVFDGISISHHNEGKLITKQNIYAKQGLNLDKELKLTAKLINDLAGSVEKVYVVKSNHDEHLYRYLEEGRFIEDTPNQVLGAELFIKAINGEDPLQAGLNKHGLYDNVVFLQRDADLKYKGIQLANHGDKGANGARGSPRSTEEANGKSITGHIHTTYKIRDTYTVATSSVLRMGYNVGYSNWLNNNAIINVDGSVQLLNTINKGYKVK